MATTACDLYPEEIMDVIKQAYDNGLIYPGTIRLSDFEKALELGRVKCFEKLKYDMERDCLDDIHAAMSWWACFNEERVTFSSSPGIADDFTSGGSKHPSNKFLKKQKKTKKKKRKQARASKKKNRR